MSSVIKVNALSVAEGLIQIPKGRIVPVLNHLDAIAWERWVLGGSDRSFRGLNNGRLLSLISKTPMVYHDDYISMRIDDAGGNYLESALSDNADRTVIVAYRKPAGTTGLYGIAGNYSVGGFQLWSNEDSFTYRAFPNVSRAHNVSEISSGTTWFVVAMAVTNSVINVAWTTDGAAISTDSQQITGRDYGSRNLRLGWHDGGTPQGESALHDFAEFMLYEKALTTDELTSQVGAMYSRLAEKGLI